MTNLSRGFAKFGNLGYGCVSSITVTTLVGRPPVRVVRYTLSVWPSAACTGTPTVISCDDYPLYFKLGRYSSPPLDELEAHCVAHALAKALLTLPDGSSVCENPTGRYKARHTVWVTKRALAEFEVRDLLHRVVYSREGVNPLMLTSATLEFEGSLIEAHCAPEGVATPLTLTPPEGRVQIPYEGYDPTLYLPAAAQYLADAAVCPMRSLLLAQDQTNEADHPAGGDDV